MVTHFPSLKKLNFLPSLFGISWLFLLLVYQITVSFILTFNKQKEFFDFLSDTSSHPYFWTTIITVIIIFIIYAILNPIARGWMIEMMHTYRTNSEQKIHRSWQWFFDGLSHFLPMFEVQNITSIFAPLTIITTGIFLYRFLDPVFYTTIGIVIVIYLLFSFLLNMCFAYSPFFIVLEWKKWVESLSLSTNLAIRNITITTKLYFTNILLYLRIIFIGALFFFMPFIISSLLAYFTAITVKIIFLVIFGIIATIFFIFIVHLNSTLEIFILALWYEAYIYCKEEK